MSRTLESRIKKLENSIGWRHPGEIKAREWFGFIFLCELRNFTYLTELLRPSRDLAYMVNDYQLDMREETAYWRAENRKLWREAFWSRREENLGDPYYQGEDDPDFPGEKQIRTLMDYMLSYIDPLAFEWHALYFLKARINGKSWHGVNENFRKILKPMVSLEPRARYFRQRRMNSPNLFSWPDWAIEIYRKRGQRKYDYWVIPRWEGSP